MIRYLTFAAFASLTLNALAADPGARALYLFPTKALSRDQAAELQALMQAARPGPSPLNWNSRQ